MTHSIPPQDEIENRAAHWLLRLMANDELTAEEQGDLRHWLVSDARHGEILSQQVGLWHAFADLPSDLREKELRWLDTFMRHRDRQRQWWRIGGFSLAAGVLFALAGAAWLHFHARGPIPMAYATNVGETRNVRLPDGSLAQLNTHTRLQWISDARQRRVVLLDGEALFDVARDASRPFQVAIDQFVVQALGTQFNAYRKPDGEVIVTVLDGAVEVRQDHPSNGTSWPKVVHANERLAFQDGRPVPSVQPVAAREVVQWPQGILDVDDQTLVNVVSELTRYTRKRIVVRNPALWQVRMTGALNTRDIRDALGLLQQQTPMTVTETGDAFVLDYRPKSTLGSTR